MENISKGGDIYPNENIMKEEISIGGYYEGGERYHAEAVGEIEGRVPWASTHIHCITHLVVRMRISIMVMMVRMMIVRMIIQYRFYRMTIWMMCSIPIPNSAKENSAKNQLY